MRLRPHVSVALVALLGGICTAAVAAVPQLSFAYNEPGVHIVMESASGLIAIFASLLLFGRLALAPRIDFLLLASALLLFGITNLGVAGIPDALTLEGTHSVSSWGALVCRLIGDLMLMAAAFAPQHELKRPSRAIVLAITAVLLVVVTTVSLVVALRASLPDPISSPRQATNRPDIDGHFLVHAAQLMGLIAYASATIAFARRSERQGDSFIGWLSLAMTFGALARLNYLLNPSLYSPWFYTGDAFRLLAYLTLLVAAFSEIGQYWRRLADAATAEERRRIARDLHDGVAQELAYIVREGKRLSAPDPVLRAAERGLDEARLALHALDRPSDESLEDALLHATEDVAAQSGVHLELEVGSQVEVSSRVRETLARIAREAVVNAGRHGHAHVVRIGVNDGDTLALTVRDDGVGFDPARSSSTGTGHGLTTMRERAERLGGSLSIRSLPGRGTRVEVVLP